MAVQYDPKIIVTFAERLYKQADSIVASYAMFAGLFGALAGAAAGAASMNATVPGLLAGLVLFALLGYVAGQARAFALRLQAQIALCQVQIESNTRGVSNRMVA